MAELCCLLQRAASGIQKTLEGFSAKGKREGTIAYYYTRAPFHFVSSLLSVSLSCLPLGFRYQRRRSAGGAALRADITRGAAISGGGGRWPRRRLCSDLGRDLDGDSRPSGRR